MGHRGRRRAHASATANCARLSAASPHSCAQRGIGRNDRVALLANNSIEQLLCYFGVMAAGATICTIHVEMNRNQLGNIFERLKPRLILYQDGLQLDDLLAGTTAPRMRLGRWDNPEPDTLFAELARCAPSEPAQRRGPDDDAVILFTSGTSATPKGVVLNYREYLSNIDPLAAGFGITADDRLYDFRPFQLDLGADSWARWRSSTAAPPWFWPENSPRAATLPHLRDHARDHRRRQSDDRSTSCSTASKARIATTCRSCASSRRARRRSCSKSGSGSSRNSASRSRKVAAPAR